MNFIYDEKFKIIKDIVVVILLIAIIIMNSFMIIKKNEKVVVNPDKKVALVSEEEVDMVKEEDKKCEKDEKVIYVDVKGAVKKPGVYLMKDGEIVDDAIKAAGGITNKGVTKNINLSKKVEDQMVIYIYTNSELISLKKDKEIDTKENVLKEICNCPSYEISNCEGASIINNSVNNENNDSLEIVSENNKVNINNATKEQLLTLSGIGESKALAIIEYRNSTGGFKSIEDIKNVSGIGEALFAKIKDSITV